MKRRTVILEIEIEGSQPDPYALRDAILREFAGRGSRAIHAEIIKVTDEPAMHWYVWHEGEAVPFGMVAAS